MAENNTLLGKIMKHNDKENFYMTQHEEHISSDSSEDINDAKPPHFIGTGVENNCISSPWEGSSMIGRDLKP